MPKIRIDGNSYEVADGRNVLEAALSLGLDLPYFCWHPALGSVGACRQCAIKQFRNEQDSRGRIVMACMTPALEGAHVSISDPEAKAFRTSVIEWLMQNHPHDCPICDEGGECHLQDMTLMTGHVYRRSRFRKRTYRNQDLGPFVNHEMNRCIACYRCVRFYRDYAGGHDLNVFASHDRVYFGRFEDGVLESEFSGNLVEVCPTGVFTDKTLKKHYTRKWDLQTAPSVCVHCGLGCNTIPGERYGMLRRIRNRYHEELNGYFLCDRGRYGYEFVNSDRRIRQTWFRTQRDSSMGQAAPLDAMKRLGERLRPSLASSRTIGIGSPRASLEANYALRALVGAEHFHSGLSDLDSDLIGTLIDVLKRGPVPSATLRDIERADGGLVLGEDTLNTAPRLALAIRQSVHNAAIERAHELKIPAWQDASVRELAQELKSPLFIVTPFPSKLDEVATQSLRMAPDDIARLGFAIAHILDERFPGVPELSDEMRQRAESIARALLAAKRPAIVSGTGIRSPSVLRAAANIASALHGKNSETRIFLTSSEVNSVGLHLLQGRPLSEAFMRMTEGDADTVIIVENDLFRRADAERVKNFLAKSKLVVLVEHTATAMVPRADVILPAATFAESDGTFVNNEGRAQRFFQVFVPGKREETTSGFEGLRPGSGYQEGPCQESWRWLRDLMIASGRSDAKRWISLDHVITEMVRDFPELGPASVAAPSSNFRLQGERIARQSHRYSGRTSIQANVTVHEPKPPEDLDSPFSFSMEGFQGMPPAPLIERYWAPGWNSVQSLNKFQVEVGGPLRGGPAGKRLFAPTSGAGLLFREIPAAFSARVNRWLALPIHHIFGSEELSLLSPGISKLAPRPYFLMNAFEAARLGIRDDEPVEIILASAKPIRLPARLESSVPSGIIGIPVGLAGLEGSDVQLPAWSEVYRQRIAGAA